MKIANVASEINPLCKTGGLADVVYALSRQLVKVGDEVICILPLYRKIQASGKFEYRYIGSYDVVMDWRVQNAQIYMLKIQGITFYLIGNDYYFGRDGIYGYDDDGERFAFFTLAAKSLFKFIDFTPDIVHVHDWQAGMLPVLLKVDSEDRDRFAHTHSVLTIHNPAFKGYIGKDGLKGLYNLPESLYDDGSVRFDGMVSTLKAGIVFADKITTVSPQHAQELLTPEFSQGLHGVLEYRRGDFFGIVNGIDEEEWDSSVDPKLPYHYSAKSFPRGKAENRKALCQLAGLKDNEGPLFGLVSRLTYQKGIDLVIAVGRGILERGGMLAILGSGEYELEEGLKRLQADFPETCSVYIGYSDDRAHLIYAASDFFLMPSLFEPCGIGQMVAERYGALPIARDTGGLHDTIVDYCGSNEDVATGFLFRDYDYGGLNYGVHEAERAFRDKPVFRALQKNAMLVDHGWAASANLYRGMYLELLNR